MKTFLTPKFLWLALGALLALPGTPAFACAACFGKSDSPLAKGMNWGIFVLLGMVAFVLSAFGTFLFYIFRKSASMAASQAQMLATPEKA